MATVTLFSAKATTGSSKVYRIVSPEPESTVAIQASGGFTGKDLVLETSLDGSVWTTAVDDIQSGSMHVGPQTPGQLRATIGSAGTGNVTLKMSVAVGSFSEV